MYRLFWISNAPTSGTPTAGMLKKRLRLSELMPLPSIPTSAQKHFSRFLNVHSGALSFSAVPPTKARPSSKICRRRVNLALCLCIKLSPTAWRKSGTKTATALLSLGQRHPKNSPMSGKLSETASPSSSPASVSKVATLKKQ